MVCFVLVHGGCHGGWCYDDVAQALRASGYVVFAPTLSGLGERAGEASRAINLSTHVNDVVGEIEKNELNDVVLVGHSYGGMVITGVVGQLGERIRSLVYIDGCVPEDGQSLFDIVGPKRTLRMLASAGETGFLMPAPGAAFFQVRAENAERVDQLCTPHPIACFIQRLRHTGRETLVQRRLYLLCARYQSINYSTAARVKNLPGWRVASLDCGHDAMIDEPELVTALLLEEALANG